MYRFLLTPRWLGLAALAAAMAAVMVLLGNWQLSRYHERSAINDRIDSADREAPIALERAMATPTVEGDAGAPPASEMAWRRVIVSGRYDAGNEILVRGRTVDGNVGFEVVTPLVLTDGAAVLVDRGWVPPAPGGAMATPDVPPAPTGPVTVIGKVHLSESRAGPVDRREGRLETRRIGVGKLAGSLPYPVYGGYLLLTEQQPAADPDLRPIPIDRLNDWQNGGYAVQWWLFAAMTLVGYGWLARREAHPPAAAPTDRVATSAEVS